MSRSETVAVRLYRCEKCTRMYGHTFDEAGYCQAVIENSGWTYPGDEPREYTTCGGALEEVSIIANVFRP